MATLMSCEQTVRVRVVDSDEWELEESMRPVCPVKPPPGHAFLSMSKGALTYFYSDGDVIRILPNGTTHYWTRKPTLQDIFQIPRHSSMYVEFKKDGSVESWWEQRERVFWGPDTPAKDIAPTNGLQLIQLEPQADDTDETTPKEILEFSCECAQTCNAPVLDPDFHTVDDDASSYGGMCDCICCR
jgi:hypothetical protein